MTQYKYVPFDITIILDSFFSGKYQHLIEDYSVTCLHKTKYAWYWQLYFGSELIIDESVLTNDTARPVCKSITQP